MRCHDEMVASTDLLQDAPDLFRGACPEVFDQFLQRLEDGLLSGYARLALLAEIAA